MLCVHFSFGILGHCEVWWLAGRKHSVNVLSLIFPSDLKWYCKIFHFIKGLIFPTVLADLYHLITKVWLCHCFLVRDRIISMTCARISMVVDWIKKFQHSWVLITRTWCESLSWFCSIKALCCGLWEIHFTCVMRRCHGWERKTVPCHLWSPCDEDTDLRN